MVLSYVATTLLFLLPFAAGASTIAIRHGWLLTGTAIGSKELRGVLYILLGLSLLVAVAWYFLATNSQFATSGQPSSVFGVMVTPEVYTNTATLAGLIAGPLVFAALLYTGVRIFAQRKVGIGIFYLIFIVFYAYTYLRSLAEKLESIHF